jgi:DNA replication and repair protein RecF
MTTATSSCRSASTPDRAAGASAPARAWTARRLELADVRCWRRAALELPDGLLLIVGPNGAGKTSVVEALTLGCLGVSPRTAREAEVVRRGAEALHVALDLDGPPGRHLREIGYAPGRGRRLRLDGEAAPSLSAWRARAVLVFLPDELRAVKGPPAARRRALDRVLEAAAPGFAEDLAAYGEALAQRNALLRRIRAGAASEASLPAWEAPMAARGARVAAARRAGAAALAGPFRGWLAALGGGADGVVRLETSPALAEVPDDALEAALAASLRERRAREVQAGQTLSGPHRDDLLLAAGPTDLRRSGSQGEQRTAALALLLAARDHLRERAARPILLLDDVLSELDPARRRLLLEAVRDGGQTLVTSADPAAADALSDPPDALVTVENGAFA